MADVSLNSLGEYFGDPDPESISVLSAFVNKIDFAGLVNKIQYRKAFDTHSC